MYPINFAELKVVSVRGAKRLKAWFSEVGDGFQERGWWFQGPSVKWFYSRMRRSGGINDAVSDIVIDWKSKQAYYYL